MINTYFQYGVKVFIKYFISVWVLTLIFALIYTTAEIDVEKDYTLHLIAVYSNSALSILILIYLSHIENNKLKFLSKHSFEYKSTDIVLGVLIGVTIGGILPYLSNFGYYASETSFIKEYTDIGLASLKAYFVDHKFIDLIFLGILNTIIFPIFRAIFFYGILYNIFIKDLGITRSTIQVTLFFVLANLIFQTNQLDVISLFGQSIILCYIYYRTQSMAIIAIASIFYDLPVYIFSTFSDFQITPEKYMVPNIESYSFIVIWSICGFIGFNMLNLFYRKHSDDEI